MRLLKDPRANWPSTAITGLTDKGTAREAYLTLRAATGRYTRYRDGEEEYYDTRKDPHEWTNRIDHPESASDIETLRAALPVITEVARPLPPVMKKGR